jgi:hypothetical protein
LTELVERAIEERVDRLLVRDVCDDWKYAVAPCDLRGFRAQIVHLRSSSTSA